MNKFKLLFEGNNPCIHFRPKERGKCTKNYCIMYAVHPRILVVKPEGRRPLGRPRRKWVGNIKIDLREIRWDYMDWIDLA
jgi:hypothetical protein